MMLKYLFFWTVLLSFSSVLQAAPVGILSALGIELELLLKEANVREVIRIGGVDYYLADLGSSEVVLAKTGGYGILPSATTSILIHEFGVGQIIFSGIAGGVADQTHVLDVVVSSDFLVHDCGTITDAGFVWKADCGVAKDGSIPADARLREVALAAATQVVGKARVFEGRIVSGEAFVSSPIYVDFLRDRFDAYAVESEGAPVARVAYEFDIPVVAIRTLSDKADGKAEISYENFSREAADQSARIVLRMLNIIN